MKVEVIASNHVTMIIVATQDIVALIYGSTNGNHKEV